MTSSTTSATPATSYLPALTGIRAVAAYLVFVHHFNPFPERGITRLLHNIILEFHIGVSIFFVLSGFLITLRYSGSSQWTGSWWRKYLRNRIARIYPIYFLITCLTFFVLYQVEGKFEVGTWLANISFLRGFCAQLIYTGIPQGWTLTVEECFYLFAPVAFWLLAHRRISLWFMPFGLLALGGILVLICQPLAFYGLFANFKFMLLYTFFGRCFEFFAGMQLAIWFRSGQLRHYSVPGLLTGTGLLVIALALAGMVWIRGTYMHGQEHPFGVFINNIALPGGVVMLFSGLLTEATWFRAFLSTSLLQVLGKSSYIFYLIHVGVIQQFLRTHIKLQNDLVGFVIVFILLNLLAVGLHYLVEQPLNNILRHRPARVSPAAVSVTAG